jgi:hypothetical protein
MILYMDAAIGAAGNGEKIMAIGIQKDLHTIKIGHGAYSGANALKFVTSKSAAVNELRARGFTRNAAREVIKDVSSRPSGYQIAEGKRGLVEVHAMNHESSWVGYV